MKKSYKIKIEPLTAVHVGTGEKLTPLDYKIVNVKSSDGKIRRKYARFSTDSILRRIATDEKLSSEFDKFSEKSDMKSLQTFFHNQIKNEDILYLCEVTKDFEEKYNENIKKDPLQNAAEVLEMYRPESSKFPTIPGSSIKGAIRTALVDCVRDCNNDFDFYKAKKNKRFESELLGYKDAKSDPFRTIRVSDCNFTNSKNQGAGSLQIINNKTGHLSDANKSQVMAEVILGSFVRLENTGQYFTITIDDDLQKSGNFNQKFKIKDIISECNYFYGAGFLTEYKTFYKNENSRKTELIEKLASEIKKIKEMENSFVIRLGRWSQFEFVTLYDEKHKYGTSRTVFYYDGQYLPMGWCKCTVEEDK